VDRQIDPDSLDVIVPSMLLQPLVENCIKHGFSRKVGPGTITLRSRREGDTAVIEVEDDGLGISDERLAGAVSGGIGLSNVNERLRVLYGATGRFSLAGAPGKGARARLEIPLVVAAERITA
jgi:two-component system LytT family sensor kinase